MVRACLSAAPLALMALLPLLSTGCSDLESPIFNDYIGPKAQAPDEEAPPVELPEPIPQATSTSAPATMADITGQALAVSVHDAILMTLENNKSFAVQRYSPQIRRTAIDAQRAAFDPLVAGRISTAHSRTPSQGLTRSGTELVPGGRINWNSMDSTAGALSLSEFLPTGTDIALTASGAAREPGSAFGDTSRVELDVTQSLLRGAGLDVNLASLRQAKLDALASQYELRGFAEAMIAQAEQTYWNYALALRQIELVEDSRKLALQQLSDVRERVNVGTLAEKREIPAAEAEVAQRELDLIVARANVQTTRLQLLRLLSPSLGRLWERDVTLVDPPTVPDINLPDVENYVRVALRMRPDVNQARLQVKRGDLQVVKTRNGLLPRLDAFINLGKTGYSNSFFDSAGHIGDKGYDLTVGVSGDWSPINRAAQAANKSAILSRDQSKAAVSNLEQLVQTDVRTAYIQVIRFKQQVATSAVARRAQEETLRAETEKFHVGKSTSFLVAQAQRDLLSSQLAEVQAQVNYMNAIVDLYRLDGSLLERRGIVAPGRQPVAP